MNFECDEDVHPNARRGQLRCTSTPPGITPPGYSYGGDDTGLDAHDIDLVEDNGDSLVLDQLPPQNNRKETRAFTKEDRAQAEEMMHKEFEAVTQVIRQFSISESICLLRNVTSVVKSCRVKMLARATLPTMQQQVQTRKHPHICGYTLENNEC